MSSDPYSTISTRVTDQSRPADPTQRENNAGGYTFVVDDMTRFRRFIATGTEGGTYYVGQDEHTAENADNVVNLARTRGSEMLDVIITASVGGHTVKQNPLMLSYAAVAALSDDDTRKRALDALPDICRTGTHLFLFAKYIENFRGWGRGLRRAVGGWYLDRDIDGLTYQIAKYQAREGFSHRDMLRLAHPKGTGGHADLFGYVTGKGTAETKVPRLLTIVDALNDADDVSEAVGIISTCDARLSWEMVPSKWLGEVSVWRALLDGGHVPIGALLRNLARLTTNGLIAPFGDLRTERVAGRLTDPEALVKGRVHPMSVLLAAATYASGRSLRGSGMWSPVSRINKALDEAFPLAFGSIVPNPDKRVIIGVDVSGSMDMGSVGGLPLTPRDAAAALAQVYAAQFPKHVGVAFTGNARSGRHTMFDQSWGESLTSLDIDPSRRTTDIVNECRAMDFGRTDCSLPILHAIEHGLAVDAFVVLTDSETWAGKIHPHQALAEYRRRSGIAARMVTVSMVANNSTIADPSDPLMLDVVGLDSSTVSLVGDFIAGNI